MKMTFALAVLAALVCGARVSVAQDQTANNNNAPATQPEHKDGKHMGKHMKGMDACKDDVKQFCADAKGHKAIHECLEKNEDSLSQGCKDARAKMMKHEKHGKKKMGGGEMNNNNAPATPPAGGQ